MAKRAKKPKNVLKLPDLDYSKSAVLNSLPSLNSDDLTITPYATLSSGTAPNPGSRSTRL
jgi:hypothetical protein